ncbi:MAG: hypothetical protein ACFB15_30955 [Cyclobacteriaceae bacterium]
MGTSDLNTKIINGYLGLLKNLSPSSKLDLISKLTQSVKSDIRTQKKNLVKAFGAWDQEESADELVNTVRDSRLFSRQIEEL